MRPSVPDSHRSVPFPDDSRDLLSLTVVADGSVTGVLSHKSETFGLGAENMSVLGVDLSPALAIVPLGSAGNVLVKCDVLIINIRTFADELLLIKVIVFHELD